MKEIKKTIAEWSKDFNVKVLDPDGFDRTDRYLHEKVFTRAEFEHGLAKSTAIMLPFTPEMEALIDKARQPRPPQRLTFLSSPGVVLMQGDITKLEVDAIVNAAKSSLMGGGGVDGAIHAAGGIEILKECYKIVETQGECKPGEAVVTTGGDLPAKWVIHTVGPVGTGSPMETNTITEPLWLCYFRSLMLAKSMELKSIAFPNISTGIYRVNKLLAARLAIQAVRGFRAVFPASSVEEVIFCCYDTDNFEIYKRLLTDTEEN